MNVKEVLGVTVNTDLVLLPGQQTTPEFLALLNSVVNSGPNYVAYLAIDPGKANGVCGYTETGDLVFMLTVQANDMTMFLKQFNTVKNCIIENFKLFPNKARQQIYSDMETSRVIGRVETWAQLNDVKLIKQMSNVKATGYAWIGEKPLPKSNKMNHQLDAHVHFIYWAVRNGLINIQQLIKKIGD